ncbi:MAG: DinB family protein [Flavobacteriaceae bacterium]|nr:DinB family protein [Flavobacteriaceae bacterium]
MEKSLQLLGHNRQMFKSLLTKFTLTEINSIPKGFNNNIFWNIAHCMVSFQRLVYHYSGLPMGIPEKWMRQYNKGTAPTARVTQKDVDELISLFDAKNTQLLKDLDKGIFKNYEVYTTSTKMELKSVEDAIMFCLVHEGLHVGSVLALAKLV